MADNPKTMGMPQEGYTQQSLEDDVAASIRVGTKSSVLTQIEANIRALNTEIAGLEQQTSQVLQSPGLIPVPEDEKINPLLVIGQTLRSIGGDSRGLDALVAKKAQAADYQRQVAAQNVVIQNRYQKDVRENILDQLSAKKNRIERYEMEAAKILDEEASGAEERRIGSFEIAVRGLADGIGTAESVTGDFPQEFLESGLSIDFLKAAESRGKIALDRAEKLAAPDPPETPRTTEGATNDAESATLLLSRGYYLAPKLNSAGVEIGKEQVPLTPSEAQVAITRLEAAIGRMSEDQAKIWQPHLDRFKMEFGKAPGPQEDDLSMLQFAEDLQKFVYG